jgi:hypothetical protein
VTDAEQQRLDAAAARRVSFRAAQEASRILREQLERDVADLAGDRVPKWLRDELGQLLRDAEEGGYPRQQQGEAVNVRIRHRRIRWRLTIAADGALVSVRDERRR